MIDSTEQAEALRVELDALNARRVRAHALVDRRRSALEEARARAASLDAEAREVREKLRALVGYSRGRTLTPHAQAGRYATVALGVLRSAGEPLSQSQVGSRGGIGTGTLTHAMQALVSDGLIVPTGKRSSRSMVYRLTPKGRRARGLTRRPPGS